MPAPELLAKTVDGILFSAPMILALLAGRKTVTRRTSTRWLKRKPGDLLFVKETWRPVLAHHCAMDACDCADVNVSYAATPAAEPRHFSERDIPDAWEMPAAAVTAKARAGKAWVSAMLLPRWASRLVLRITEPPTHEPLHDIDDEDAKREGVELPAADLPQCPCEGEDEEPGPHLPHCLWRQPHVDPHESGPYLAGYVCLWEELRPKKGQRWEDNPMVVRIPFEIVGGA